MAETLMSRTFEYRQRWGEAAEPMPLVERSRVLNDRLRLHDLIGEQVDVAQDSISELLNGLVKGHVESGMIRTGTTLKDAIQVIVDCSARMIDNFASRVDEQARTPETFTVIEDALVRFFAFLELELKSIIDKVKFELQDHAKALRFQEAAQRMWSGERAEIESKVEHLRATFNSNPPVEPLKVVAETDKPDESNAGMEGSGTMQTDAEQSNAGITLKGQPITDIRIASDPSLSAEESQQGECDPAVRTMWSNLVVDIWNGLIRPRSQSDWREAIGNVCERHAIVPETVGIDECARLLWWNTVASQHVLSSVRTTIVGEVTARTFGTFGASEAGPRQAFSRNLTVVATGTNPAGEHAGEVASYLAGDMTLEAPAVDIG